MYVRLDALAIQGPWARQTLRIVEVFGRRLRELRLERDLTQDALSQRYSTSKPFISDLERGVKVPSLTIVLRLAEALECEPTDLIEVFNRRGPKTQLR